MRCDERAQDVGEPLRRHDGLDAQLGNAFLLPRLAHRRVCAFTAEERPCPGGVPRAALVVANPPGACTEDRVAGRVERILGDEPDELVRLHRRSMAAASAEATKQRE